MIINSGSVTGLRGVEVPGSVLMFGTLLLGAEAGLGGKGATQGFFDDEL